MADGGNLAASVRVLLVYGPSTGGIRRHVERLAAELRTQGAVVTVSEAFQAGKAIRPWSVWTAGRAMDVSSIEVVHVHGTRAALAAIIGRRGVPLVVTFHNAPMGPAWRRRIKRLVMCGLARQAVIALAVSEDLAQMLGRRRDVRRALIASNLPAPQQSPGNIRDEFGVDGGCALVVAIGRLHPQKGFDMLIEAAELLRISGHHVAVRIVGEGPARAALQRQCTMTQADVRLVGHRSDVADVVAAADVVVMPSRWEGWPMTAAEVLSAGRPLIATAVGGIPELVEDAAVLVPPDDAGALATAITDVVTDPDIAHGLEVAALERAGSLPTDQEVAAQLLAIYRTARCRGAR